MMRKIAVMAPLLMVYATIFSMQNLVVNINNPAARGSIVSQEEKHSATDYLKFLYAIKGSPGHSKIFKTTLGYFGEDYEAVATDNYTKDASLGVVLGMKTEEVSLTKELNVHFNAGNTKFETTDKKKFNAIIQIPRSIRIRYHNDEEFFKVVVKPTLGDKLKHVAAYAGIGLAGGVFIGAAGAYGLQSGQHYAEATEKTAELQQIASQKAQQNACIGTIQSTYHDNLSASYERLNARGLEYTNLVATTTAAAGDQDLLSVYNTLADIRKQPGGEIFFASNPQAEMYQEAVNGAISAGAATALVAAGSIIVPQVTAEPVTLDEMKSGIGYAAFGGVLFGLGAGLTTMGYDLRNKPLAQLKPTDRL